MLCRACTIVYRGVLLVMNNICPNRNDVSAVSNSHIKYKNLLYYCESPPYMIVYIFDLRLGVLLYRYYTYTNILLYVPTVVRVAAGPVVFPVQLKKC